MLRKGLLVGACLFPLGPISFALSVYIPTGNTCTPFKATSVLASVPPTRGEAFPGSGYSGSPRPAAGAVLEDPVLPEVPRTSLCRGSHLTSAAAGRRGGGNGGGGAATAAGGGGGAGRSGEAGSLGWEAGHDSATDRPADGLGAGVEGGGRGPARTRRGEVTGGSWAGLLRGRAGGPRPCRPLARVSPLLPITVSAPVGEAPHLPGLSGLVLSQTANSALRRGDGCGGVQRLLAAGTQPAPCGVGRLFGSLAPGILPRVSLVLARHSPAAHPLPEGEDTEPEVLYFSTASCWYLFTTLMNSPASFFHRGTWGDQSWFQVTASFIAHWAMSSRSSAGCGRSDLYLTYSKAIKIFLWKLGQYIIR